MLAWILFGMVIGAMARLLIPAADGGWIIAVLLGVAGAVAGGFLASTVIGGTEQAPGIIGSAAGSLLLLSIYRLLLSLRRS